MPCCKNCDNHHLPSDAKFCPQCGTEYTREDKLPYIGECPEKGVFRITFAPVEGEFDHEDEANDAARHSHWNTDDEFGDYTLEKLRSTVTPETHPYICGECRDYVAEHTEGKCSGCGAKKWRKRQ